MLYQAKSKGLAECGHDLRKIQGRVNYLLDVLRGKDTLTALERKTLVLAVWYFKEIGADQSWAKTTLDKKSKTHPS